MGIRSLLRKVFGRDRADQHVETTATSVPSQTASERATPDEAGSVTLPSPTPPDEAAKRAADDLVAASFDNPKVPQARTSSTRESVRTGGTGSSSDTPQEPETPTESTGVPAARDGAEAEEAAAEAPAEAEAEESAEAEAETPAEPEAEADATEAPETEAEPAEAVAEEPDAEAEPETDEAEVTAEPETADAEAETVEAEADATDEAPEAEAEPAEAVAEEPAAEAEPETDEAEPAEAEAEVTAEPETADAEPEPAPTEAEAEAEATDEPEPTEAEAEAEVTEEPEPTPTEAEAEATTPTPALTLAAVKAKAPQLADAYKAAGTVLKKQGLTGARAAVYLVVDRSGSMRGYFKDGSVQRIAEQTVALAAHLTEDATVTAVFFSTDIDGTAELRPEGIAGRIDEINADLGRLGRTNYHRAVEEVLAHHEKTDPTRPAFVVFQTDGAPDLKTAATEALAQAADRPIHWQFVAWGEEDNKAFDYLRKLTAPRTGTFFAGATPAETGHPAFFRGLLADWQTQDEA